MSLLTSREQLSDYHSKAVSAENRADNSADAATRNRWLGIAMAYQHLIHSIITNGNSVTLKNSTGFDSGRSIKAKASY